MHAERLSALAKASLLTVSRQHLRLAVQAEDGHSQLRLCSTDSDAVQQSLVALRCGERLREEYLPTGGLWTVQVLQGRLRYSDLTRRRRAWPGDLLIGTARPPQIEAEHDTALLLTRVDHDVAARPMLAHHIMPTGGLRTSSHNSPTRREDLS